MSTLAERIAALCTCRVHDYGICCGGSDFRCACCIDCRKNKPKATCKQECHAIAGEVERATRKTGQGCNLAHMCRDNHQEIHHNDSEHEMCPLCRASAEVAALTAKVSEGHALNCKCCAVAEKPYKNIGVPFCRSAHCGVQVEGHPIVDSRCVEWRNRRG